MRPNRIWLRGAAGLAAATLIASTIAQSPAVAADSTGIVAVPGYSVSVSARGTVAWTNPDAIVVAGDHVFIDYQNQSAKDGSNANPSTIVEYNSEGDVERNFSIPGHSDGLRVDPATGDLWATVNEDAKPSLFVIDPSTGHATRHRTAGSIRRPSRMPGSG